MKAFLIFAFIPIVALQASNQTEQILHRDKRFFIFNNGGIMKAVMGIAIPVDLENKRSLIMGYNFQSQYAVLPTATSFYSSPLFLGASRNSDREARESGDSVDDSREMVYQALESVWSRKGRSGRQCLLRAVCEIAQNPLSHNGLFGEIIDAVFTPGEDTNDEDILDAQRAGLQSADCLQVYAKCPLGLGYLDMISNLKY